MPTLQVVLLLRIFGSDLDESHGGQWIVSATAESLTLASYGLPATSAHPQACEAAHHRPRSTREVHR